MEDIKPCPLCFTNKVMITTQKKIELRCLDCSLGLCAPKNNLEYLVEQWNSLPRVDKETVDNPELLEGI